MTNPLTYPKRPQIYVYSSPNQPGLKIGYTERVTKSRDDFDAVKERIEEGLVRTPNKQYKIEHYELAITDDGEYFTDHRVHKELDHFDQKRLAGEWYDTTVEIVKQAIKNIKTGKRDNITGEQKATFKPRPEQEKFIKETAAYFNVHKDEKEPPHYLWNAKMRFGKTFTAYELAKKMDWKRVLVLTYKPGVEKEWKTDLYGHQDFDGWQFIEGLSSWDEEAIDESRPVVWFASYQDVLVAKNQTLKERHKKMREIDWDCIYVDEYHFGAWREAAKELGQEEKKESDAAPEDMDETSEIENILPLKTHGYLYLSGTPFRALTDGEFNEDQISNWTYADEQNAKRKWDSEGQNPYLELPQIVMLTYQMPESLREVAKKGDLNEFDLNRFFATKKDENGKDIFVNERDVKRFLNILHGADLEIDIDNEFDYQAPALPFEDSRLLSTLRHTFWFLPSVPACKAMEDLLRIDPFYKNYEIIRAAGNDTPGGKNAKDPVVEKIGDGLNTMSITLSCGKLTTGVTIPAWSGVLFLRNTDAPETYFQTAFRAQSPWTIRDTEDPMKKNILKNTCYVIDFAPTRALKLIADYSEKLIPGKKRPELKVQKFIRDLPILCFDGGRMISLNANDILDISAYGTASTMLARRWQSARLVDTTTVTLEKVLNNPEILAALEKIEGFRNLRNDLKKVITREKDIQKSKQERAGEGRAATKEEKAEENEEQKERLSFKKKLREKLLQFVTRIPVFMYLTDYREQALTDVIRNLEPEMFTKVTGLTVREFDLMCEVGVFNQTEMNQAIAQFRRFEDKSLEYAGGRSAYEDGKVGLFDTVVTEEEADEIILAER